MIWFLRVFGINFRFLHFKRKIYNRPLRQLITDSRLLRIYNPASKQNVISYKMMIVNEPILFNYQYLLLRKEKDFEVFKEFS